MSNHHSPILSDKQVQLAQYLQSLSSLNTADSLSDYQHLSSQLSEVDEPSLVPLFLASLEASSAHHASHSLSPFPSVVVRDQDPRAAAWAKTGLEAIASGQVAMVVLAGGQGTRLGSSSPKGLYDIGLPSKKSLFQLQAEKIRAIAKLASHANHTISTSSSSTLSSSSSSSSSNLPIPSIPYVILTSEATEQATREFFAAHAFFGLPERDVLFIEQDSCPCVFPSGELLLASPRDLSLSPNGNGGVYRALAKSGVLGALRERGVRAVMISGIDNGLLRILDPQFMGMLLQEGVEAALKVVPKAYPEERVGVLGLIDGKPNIVEYSELDPKEALSVDAQTGELRFNAGNICIHAFSMGFLQRCGDSYYQLMPYHLAFKAVPFWDPVSRTVVHPAQPNAYKLEKFVFDVLPHCTSLMAMQVSRAAEFAPVKNAPGAQNDTPATSRALISALHRRWLQDNGAVLEGPEDALVEISPLVSLEGEGLSHFNGQTISLPFYLSDS